MKEKQGPRLQRAEKFLEIISKIKLSAEELKLISEGYGHEGSYKEKLSEITQDSKDFLLLLDAINYVAKNGEDEQSVVSC